MILLASLLSIGGTTLFLTLRHPFDDFAEVILSNKSGESIRSIELRQRRLEISEPDIKPEEERLVRFYVDAPDLNDWSQLTVHFADGHSLRYSDRLGNCEKHTIRIYRNTINTMIRRSTTL